MLKIPEPQETTTLKVTLLTSTKKEFDIYVTYLKSKQPHANADAVVEAMIHKVIPRSGAESKAYKCIWQLKNEIVRGVKVRVLGSRIG